MGSLKKQNKTLFCSFLPDCIVHPSHFHFSTPPPRIMSLLLAHPLWSVKNLLLHSINMLRVNKVSSPKPELVSAMADHKFISTSLFLHALAWVLRPLWRSSKTWTLGMVTPSPNKNMFVSYVNWASKIRRCFICIFYQAQHNAGRPKKKKKNWLMNWC